MDASTWIALGSLLVSVAAAGHSIRTARRQSELEEERIAEERARALKADVRVLLVDYSDLYRGKAGTSLILHNRGGGTARNVALDNMTSRRAGVVAIYEETMFPIPEILPDGKVSSTVHFNLGGSVVFDARVTWDDGRPGRQTQSMSVTREPSGGAIWGGRNFWGSNWGSNDVGR